MLVLHFIQLSSKFRDLDYISIDLIRTVSLQLFQIDRVLPAVGCILLV